MLLAAAEWGCAGERCAGCVAACLPAGAGPAAELPLPGSSSLQRGHAPGRAGLGRHAPALDGPLWAARLWAGACARLSCSSAVAWAELPPARASAVWQSAQHDWHSSLRSSVDDACISPACPPDCEFC